MSHVNDIVFATNPCVYNILHVSCLGHSGCNKMMNQEFVCFWVQGGASIQRQLFQWDEWQPTRLEDDMIGDGKPPETETTV